MRLSLVRFPLLIAVVGLGACHRAAPDAPPAMTGPPPAVEVLKGGRWLFTYAEPAGTFATTDKPETVPAEARALVRVIDPAQPMTSQGLADRVYVANLNDVMDKGKASARAMSREAFETAALAGLPRGQSSPLAAQQMRPAPMPAVDAGLAPSPAGTPVVTIYGTSWCGACRLECLGSGDQTHGFLAILDFPPAFSAKYNFSVFLYRRRKMPVSSQP